MAEERFEARDIAMADGITVFARAYPADGAQTGLPVLCLHGLTRNSRDFELVAPRIAALGRRVIALDVRGRGRSQRDSNPANYQALLYAKDALAVLDACGVGEAIWLGTSMGGLMTMAAGTMAADRIAGVILNDVGPRLDPAGLTRIAGYVGQAPPFDGWEAAAQAVRATQGAAFPDETGPDFWRRFARRICRELPDGKVVFDYDPAIALPFKTAGAAQPVDMTPLFETLKDAPMLVIRGALSDLLSLEGVAHMRALRPDLEVVEVPRVGHAPTLEEPDAFDAIVDFLARCP